MAKGKVVALSYRRDARTLRLPLLVHARGHVAKTHSATRGKGREMIVESIKSEHSMCTA